MHVDPGRSRIRPGSPVRPRAPDPVPRCGCADALVPHRCPQAVHGRRRTAAGPRAGPAPTDISAGQRPIRAGERAVRRSVDRRGRPARRDPDVRRGATATLTAPSTARQRLGDAGRGASARSGSGVPPPAAGPAGWTMGGRDPPGLRRRRVLGYAGRSLWTVPAAFAPRSAAVRCGGVSVRSDQLPGAPGCGSRPSPGRPARARPPAGAHRRCRVVGVPREQAHVPAEQPPPVQDPRLPAADAYPRGPGDPRRSSAQGSREALRLTCCPRRHACAGVRSSPRSSGPAGAPGGRPWCSTTSPNGPSRRPVAPAAGHGAAVRCPGRFRGRQGRRQLGGPPPGHPPAARRRARTSCTGCPATADLVVRARPEAAAAPSDVAAPRSRRRARPAAGRRVAVLVSVVPLAPSAARCWPPSASTRGRSARRCRRAAASTRPAAPTRPRRSSGTAPLRGTWLALRRLLKCAPWHPGGVDLVPGPCRTPEPPATAARRAHRRRPRPRRAAARPPHRATPPDPRRANEESSVA